MTRAPRFAIAAALLLATSAAACGDDNSSDTTTGDSAVGATDETSADETSANGDSTPAGDGGGILVLDGETIELDMGRCYLEPQDSAGGGGSILATAQGSGTNAAGQTLIVDFTRYDEESMFHGDDVLVDSADGTVTLKASLPDGDIAVTDADVRAESVEMRNPETGETATASFSISC